MMVFIRGFCVLFFFFLMQTITITWGLSLLEVYSVVINNIDNENPGDLFGNIKLSNPLKQYIYNRPRNNAESIKPGENISLTGPARCVNSFLGVGFSLTLWDYDIVTKDDEVSNGEFRWTFDDPDQSYDKPLSRTVVDKYGSATVNYIVFSNAAQATVVVTLIMGDEATNEVYGEIAASNSKFNTVESMLFRRKDGDGVSVVEGKKIPLSRSVVAVPLNSSLIVRANLWDDDGPGDDELANGIATFPANIIGTSSEIIVGTYGYIVVDVTWTIVVIY